MKTPTPDFTKLWTQAVGGRPDRIQYKLRRGPCTTHDLVFISSLVHDSVLTGRPGRPKDGELEFFLTRDTWEVAYPDRALWAIKSSLRIHGVRGLQWTGRFKQRRLMLDFLWITEGWRHRDRREFTLGLFGSDWAARVRLRTDIWGLELRDLEDPPRLDDPRVAPKPPSRRRSA